MRRTCFLAAVGWMALTLRPAQAVDYSAIERCLVKEPRYESDSPQYALLLFGRQAELRVWIVLDGKRVFLDRDGDGDLTGPDERFASIDDLEGVALSGSETNTKYLLHGANRYEDETPRRSSLMIDVEIDGPASYKQYCDVGLAASPQDARLTHFDGPLTIGPLTIRWKIPPELSLATGDKPTELYAVIGTMSAEHGCWTVVRVHDSAEKSAFGAGVHPVVEIEFPSRNPGGSPVRRTYELSGFC